MGIYEVFKVLYSPVKAFKKIIEKPDFKGVLLILVIFMSFNLVAQYVVASRLFVESRIPNDENWTESEILWISNGNRSVDHLDYKVGNYSIKSFASNCTNIWMKITGIEPLNCSGDKGYKELIFWIKWINENGSLPSSGLILRLFSGSENVYFESNLTGFFASSDEWINATLKIGPEQGWNATGSPNWKGITGLEFRLVWSVPANLTMKIDDLRFQKYVSLLETGTFSASIIGFLISGTVVPFSMNWILWVVILLMITRVFREEAGPWRVFFVIIGHVFIVSVVYAIASAPLISILPQLNFPVKTWPPTTEAEIIAVNAMIEEMWYPSLAYQTVLYLPLVTQIWTAGLCAVVIRVLRGVTWGRAASIAGVAFIIRLVLIFFLGL